MSSTLADNNLVFQKIGHVTLSPREKAEAEKQNEVFRMEIRKIAAQSMFGKKTSSPKKQTSAHKNKSPEINVDAGRMF